MKTQKEIIDGLIREARSTFQLQKASVGVDISMSEWLEKTFNKLLDIQREEFKAMVEERLRQQLLNMRGVLGKYNCQHGGRECDFQTNCHRLIEKELDLLNKL